MSAPVRAIEILDELTERSNCVGNAIRHIDDSRLLRAGYCRDRSFRISMCNMVDDAQLSRAEHAAREDAYAGQVLNTAKIVTPFTAALAATLLATALQVGRPTCLDYVAAWTMAPAVLITVGIVFVQKATLKSTDLEPQAISGAHTNS
jgi:hypothetical protein